MTGSRPPSRSAATSCFASRAPDAATDRAIGVRAPPTERLDELRPEEVFRRLYRRQHAGDPPEELRAAFQDLLQAEGVT